MFLEWHHVDLYCNGGPPTVENISLRCRGDNVYESELIFGPYSASIIREGHESADRYLPPAIRRIDSSKVLAET